MPPSAFQSVLWPGMLPQSQCLSDIMKGFGFPEIRRQPKPFRVHTRANSADDKAPWSLSAEPRGSQHALPSARHLPGLAQTQPRRPPHYSLWQSFMTQQLCPDLFWEHEQMLKSVAFALLSNQRSNFYRSTGNSLRDKQVSRGCDPCLFELNRSWWVGPISQLRKKKNQNTARIKDTKFDFQLTCYAAKGWGVKNKARKEPINATHTAACRCILISRASLSSGWFTRAFILMERLEELLEETPCCPFGRRSRHETPARQPVAEARFNMSPTFSTGRDIFFFF